MNDIKKIKNPLLNNFLKIPENYLLFKKYLTNRDPSSLKKLEDTFLSYYKKVLTLSYFSKSIHFFAQKFDKKLREYAKKNSLQVDYEPKTYNLEFDTQILLENESLSKTISRLSFLDKQFLTLYYAHKLNLTEISKIQKVSLLATSKRKKMILKKLKESTT